MQWDQYVALLNWQGLRVPKSDIERVRLHLSCISKPKDILQYIEFKKLKLFLQSHPKWWKVCQSQARYCNQNGIRLTWHGQEDWPRELDKVPFSPSLLSYKGSCDSWKGFQLCLVGSRKSHTDSLSWMDFHLGSFIQKHKISILSGGARGIDQKAHSLALRFKKPTILFLPCGLDFLYPSTLSSWIEPVLQNKGAFVSLFPPSHPMRKSFFHLRNSLMVQMSHMIFVIQAEEKSGSMLTAQLAGRLGKTLCTLPGPVMHNSFQGNLNLIRDGALMIKDVSDLEALFYAEKEISKSIPVQG